MHHPSVHNHHHENPSYLAPHGTRPTSSLHTFSKKNDWVGTIFQGQRREAEEYRLIASYTMAKQRANEE